MAKVLTEYMASSSVKVTYLAKTIQSVHKKQTIVLYNFVEKTSVLEYG